MRANNVTRMLVFKGHCPNEMAKLSNSRTNIAPFASPVQGIPFSYNPKEEPSKKVLLLADRTMKLSARILLCRTTFPLHVKVGQIRFPFF